jgi:glutaredoxin
MDNCEECDQVLAAVKERNLNLETVKLTKTEGKYFTDDQTQVDIEATPTLFIERAGNDGVLLTGKEGIVDVLTKGYLHNIKLCPFLATQCKEKDCELFTIIMNNNIPEGKCANAWTPVFMLDFITGMNKYIATQATPQEKKE